MKELSLCDVEFYSEEDERVLFSWFQVITAIVSVRGEGNRIILSVIEDVDDSSLRELIALFTRYKLDLSQLARLSSSRNKKWFMNSKMYWFSDVFKV